MNRRIVLIPIMMALAWVDPAMADEPQAPSTTEPLPTGSDVKPAIDQSPPLTLAGIKDYLGLGVVLEGSYLYNVANPKGQENGNRVFDHRTNSFSPDLAELVLSHKPNVGEVGFKLKLSAGTIAELIHSNGLGASTTDVPFDLTEAYIDYVAPLGSGLTIQAGKFVTFTGAEVLEAKDNLNYSFSYLFTYAIPITHTGLMLSYTVANTVTLSAYVLNGWDNALDNNRAKTYGASVGIAPTQEVTLLLNLLAGPEQTNNDQDWRYLFDAVLTVKPTTALTFVINVDYGHETMPTGNSQHLPTTGTWSGADLIAKYDFLSWFGLAGRIEYFNDRDGYRTTVAQNMEEFTITPEFRLPANFTLRPEYRHDWSSKATFNAMKSQDTLAVAMLYAW